MLRNNTHQTIIAQCTPQGKGALALLRLSGDAALEVASRMTKLSSGKSLLEVASHTVHHGYVIRSSDATAIDQVLFIVMHGPKTFTGEHTVEITCHNNPFLVEAIMQEALNQGARVAQAGEFSKRAFLNNKIDLVQAESIHELIQASNQASLKRSLAQVTGSFSHWMQELEQQLVKALALSEASFEFIDEEMEFGRQILALIEHIQARIVQVKKTFDQQQHIRQGIRIALIGSVNAGKSSLFNALLNKNRSIVSSIAGTTRDVVEVGVYKSGSYWTLVDTAGLRQSHDVIEQEGIIRSRQEAHQADFIVVICDGSRTMTDQEKIIYQELLQEHGSKGIVVFTKSDLGFIEQPLSQCCDQLHVSIHDKLSVEQLEKKLEKKVQHDIFEKFESPFLLNQRQFRLLLDVEKTLEVVTHLLEGSVAYELVSYHLKEALENVGELSGKTITENAMNAIFREFCIGK